jgi:hypothetical protein
MHDEPSSEAHVENGHGHMENGHGHVENGHNKSAWRNPLAPQNREAIVDNMTKADHQIRAFIRENPAAVVVGAICVGFVIGRLVRR